MGVKAGNRSRMRKRLSAATKVSRIHSQCTCCLVSSTAANRAFSPAFPREELHCSSLLLVLNTGIGDRLAGVKRDFHRDALLHSVQMRGMSCSLQSKEDCLASARRVALIDSLNPKPQTLNSSFHFLFRYPNITPI